MTKTPTEGAVRAAKDVAPELLSDLHERARRMWVDSAATIIDREAVAPAVRELLLGLTVFVAASRDSVPVLLAARPDAEALIAKYRHLLDTTTE